MRGALATTAAHSHRRVLHVWTAPAVPWWMCCASRWSTPGLVHRRGVRVTQLLVENGRCCGIQALDGHQLHWIRCRAVVLASGGGPFANTTNPAQACGEGIALARQAGAAGGSEFVQFHPTALRLDEAPCFLISEAVQGGVLVDAKGGSPVAELAERDLAPRDQVSRALVHAMQRQNVQQMWLDFSAIPHQQAEARFPTILDRCGEYGLNPLERPIPVAPAAHYWMGGVATDLQAATDLPGLYAVGEVACTGVHGANRLASNSLMECLVFAGRMASIELGPIPEPQAAPHLDQCATSLSHAETSAGLMDQIEQLRQLCWRRAGVDRSVRGMETALAELKRQRRCLDHQPLLQQLNTLSGDQALVLEDSSRRDLNLLLDVSHRLLASRLLLEACLFRRESRGGHFRTDAPRPLPQWQRHSRQSRALGIRTRDVRP